MGLIDDGSAAPAPAADGGDVIAKTRAAFEQKVPAEQQDALSRIIMAGKKVLYDEKTNTEVEKRMQASQNPAEAAGSGAVELLGVLAHESRGTLPKALVGPSAAILMTEILDYLKQTGRIEGTAADLETATRAMSEAMMRAAGASPDHLDQILSKTSEAMKDPAIAAKMQQHMQGA
jgi:hypothetical protein